MRGVHLKVMSRQEVVKTAEDYSRVAAEVCQNITILYITEDEILVCRDLLDSLVFNGSKTLPGTRRMHYMEVVAPSEIKHSGFKGAKLEKVYKFKRFDLEKFYNVLVEGWYCTNGINIFNKLKNFVVNHKNYIHVRVKL